MPKAAPRHVKAALLRSTYRHVRNNTNIFDIPAIMTVSAIALFVSIMKVNSGATISAKPKPETARTNDANKTIKKIAAIVMLISHMLPLFT